MIQNVPEICQDCQGRRRTVNYDCYCVPKGRPVFQDPGDCPDKTTEVQKKELK
jgi:hypothetical protein